MHKCKKCRATNEYTRVGHCNSGVNSCTCICTDRGYYKWCRNDACINKVTDAYNEPICQDCKPEIVEATIGGIAFKFFMDKFNDLQEQINENKCNCHKNYY